MLLHLHQVVVNLLGLQVEVVNQVSFLLELLFGAVWSLLEARAGEVLFAVDVPTWLLGPRHGRTTLGDEVVRDLVLTSPRELGMEVFSRASLLVVGVGAFAFICLSKLTERRLHPVVHSSEVR